MLEDMKLKAFRCESYMLCPVQRGKGLASLQIPRNQVAVVLFASEWIEQESLLGKLSIPIALG